uniref:Uncharacterized protein n=1 Tax=Arundo donax TaxID=35708 RepID=A0A0A8ZZT2_ARUDO
MFFLTCNLPPFSHLFYLVASNKQTIKLLAFVFFEHIAFG